MPPLVRPRLALLKPRVDAVSGVPDNPRLDPVRLEQSRFASIAEQEELDDARGHPELFHQIEAQQAKRRRLCITVANAIESREKPQS